MLRMRPILHIYGYWRELYSLIMSSRLKYMAQDKFKFKYLIWWACHIVWSSCCHLIIFSSLMKFDHFNPFARYVLCCKLVLSFTTHLIIPHIIWHDSLLGSLDHTLLGPYIIFLAMTFQYSLSMFTSIPCYHMAIYYVIQLSNLFLCW